MDSQEFFNYFIEYWELTPGELAELLGKRRDTIYQWFSVSGGEPLRSPPADVVKQLRLIHFIWERWEQEETLLYPVRAIYDQVRDRREIKRRFEQSSEGKTTDA